MVDYNQVFADPADGYTIRAIHAPRDGFVPNGQDYPSPIDGKPAKLFLLLPEATPFGTMRQPEVINGVFTTYPPEKLSAAVVASYKAPIPESVEGAEGQVALVNAGRMDAVEKAIDAIADANQKRVAQIKFGAATWRRADATLTGVFKSAGMGDSDIDAVFTAAAA